MSFAQMKEGTKVFYRTDGKGSTALLFVHGWLGNSEWWNSARESLRDKYTVVAMDLPGHGRSGEFKAGWDASHYAEAIRAVVKAIPQEKVILVGHSMAGAYVLEAAVGEPKVVAIIPVDTLKILEQVLTAAQAEEFMYQHYRSDFRNAVENILPKFLFAATTPVAVKARLTKEFTERDGETAIRLLSPLYKMDLQALVRQVKVPVRAIQSDYTPTNLEGNRKFFRDYNFVSIAGTGHYPMLENPAEFDRLLGEVLAGLTSS